MKLFLIATSELRASVAISFAVAILQMALGKTAIFATISELARYGYLPRSAYQYSPDMSSWTATPSAVLNRAACAVEIQNKKDTASTTRIRVFNLLSLHGGFLCLARGGSEGSKSQITDKVKKSIYQQFASKRPLFKYYIIKIAFCQAYFTSLNLSPTYEVGVKVKRLQHRHLHIGCVKGDVEIFLKNRPE